MARPRSSLTWSHMAARVWLSRPSVGTSSGAPTSCTRGPRNFKAAAQSARACLDEVIRPIGEADEAEHLADPAARLPAREPVEPSLKGEVLAACQAAVDREVL